MTGKQGRLALCTLASWTTVVRKIKVTCINQMMGCPFLTSLIQVAATSMQLNYPRIINSFANYIRRLSPKIDSWLGNVLSSNPALTLVWITELANWNWAWQYLQKYTLSVYQYIFIKGNIQLSEDVGWKDASYIIDMAAGFYYEKFPTLS